MCVHLPARPPLWPWRDFQGAPCAKQLGSTEGPVGLLPWEHPGSWSGWARGPSCHDSSSVGPGQSPGLCLKGTTGGVAWSLLEPLACGEVHATPNSQAGASAVGSPGSCRKPGLLLRGSPGSSALRLCPAGPVGAAVKTDPHFQTAPRRQLQSWARARHLHLQILKLCVLGPLACRLLTQRPGVGPGTGAFPSEPGDSDVDVHRIPVTLHWQGGGSAWVRGGLPSDPPPPLLLRSVRRRPVAGTSSPPPPPLASRLPCII